METDREEMFELDEALSVLEATPGALSLLLEGLPESLLDFREDPEAWSPRTVVVHFIHNELTNWMPRIRVILSDAGDRRFPPFQQLPDGSDYAVQDIHQLLTEFAVLRARNLAALRELNLQPADYAREGEHPVFGTVNLTQLLATWVVHDLNHQHQIMKTVAIRYRDAVGPWLVNLAILDL